MQCQLSACSNSKSATCLFALYHVCMWVCSASQAHHVHRTVSCICMTCQRHTCCDIVLYAVLQCRLNLIILTAHILSADERTAVISMVLQALLMPPSHCPSASGDLRQATSLLECASMALLLSLLQYLLLQASQPAAARLITAVDTLLQVREPAPLQQ